MSWYTGNTGWSNKLQSDRFENPDNMLCPLWNGVDTYGRPVNADSFVTKAAGCNSAEDRVKTENFLRPMYMEYVALDSQGFRNPTMYNTTTNNPPSIQRNQLVENFAYTPNNGLAYNTAKEALDYYKITGNAGYQLSNTNTPYSSGVCGVNQGGMDCNSCGYRNRGGNKNLYEGFQYGDDQSLRNFETRRANSAVAGMKSRQAHMDSGFAF